MKKWQIENSETSEISEILFQVFLFPSFQFCVRAKIENSDLKILEKNFRDFRGFWIFYLASLMCKVKQSNLYQTTTLGFDHSKRVVLGRWASYKTLL